MQQNCNGNKNSQDFWKTVKPLISDKYRQNDNITLMENNDVVNETAAVSNIMNEYFINMASDIGTNNTIKDNDDVKNIVNDYANHESIVRIENNQHTGPKFNFCQVSAEEILNELLKVNIKKSIGYDNIPAKLIKCGAHVLCFPIQVLINTCISSGVFPNSLRKAEITPVYKKNHLDKTNYRPVSVLPSLSKLFRTYFFTPYVRI